MTEESARRRGMAAYGGQHAGYVEDEEPWQVSLESPLTAASKALMSIEGDGEGGGALGLLHDYQAFPPSDDVQLRLASISPGLYSPAESQFEYILEAPQSLRSRSPAGPMSYLNKGQFYPITLREVGGAKGQLSLRMRSVVMLVFGEEKVSEDQLKYWRFWQSRQHTIKQRCLDIADYKESYNSISNIEEIAYNAVSFTWDSRNQARVFVAVNCLSTDFSPQKGVRGLPLNLQVDTYVRGHGGEALAHRGVSQVKVFCDKGAERKIRDEEKKPNCQRSKGTDIRLACQEGSVGHLEITVFETVSDLKAQPVLFIPENHLSSASANRNICQLEEREESPEVGLGDQCGTPVTPELRHRLANTDVCAGLADCALHEVDNRVLLYVRGDGEEVFDALMLRTPTLSGLLEAVGEKYELPTERIVKVYKRCKKGILVNMDDNIIRNYSNEDTFHIHMEEAEGQILLTLTEI
ncbi:grainyhead-like protein 1 homolog [Lampris incognitus]|uniref:grainyhead-like protein 1 homolog n=1 Tax=Lampris incognitus TaxID=2546036 RepID=UPI0024B5D064|nr:grainyhead-like protein 1 homolog [Lampris incognitus]